MSQNIELHLYNKETIRIHYNDLKKITTGGQSIIFRFDYKNKNFALKAIPDEDSIYRRLKDIRDRLTINETLIPISIRFRSIPIGQGYANGEIFGLKTIKDIYILIFNWINGHPLPFIFEQEPPMSQKRKTIVKKVLELLIYLQKNQIIHSDLYPDNFLVDQKNEIYLIDLEGAGIMVHDKWLWQPLTIGKPYWFPISPELDSNNAVPNRFTDRWVGLFLIFWILNGTNPFPFFTRIDHVPLKALVSASDKNTLKWPPRIINPSLIQPYLNHNCSIEEFQRFMNNYSSTNFGRILFLTYIIGFDNPEKRVDFQIIKNSLDSFLK